ncbi:MAG: Flp family type IVb pilin [Planctomycetaceae bacterium]|nr:Flp family type IVb pilin [Planctomycetaceae bacterium]
MIRKLKSFIRDEEAATAVEYSVLLALILMAIIGTVTIVGTETNEMLGGINDSLQSTLFGS